MMSIQAFLADQYEMELALFRTALDAMEAEQFHQAKLGHSPAWHALHIAEWLRSFVFQDFSASYAHLGWEQAAWLPLLLGKPPVAESADKAAVLGELDRVGAKVVEHIRGLPDDQFTDMLRAPAAPTGERGRLIGLGLYLRHIAYHRGQVQLAKRA